MEKQLGLKLEKRKRLEPVFVIDHIEEKLVSTTPPTILTNQVCAGARASVVSNK
jgi:hypothetical protein